jgi:uncharacterized protein involved in type VI secretion and phage assembly
MKLARSRALDQRYYGVVEGIVEANDDPDKEGRIKVKFPWFDDNTVSEWCRVRQLYAGNGYGTFFVPEVGDEVLISFIHGDMRLPVILGGLYNGKDKPAVFRDQQNDVKSIRTKGKHELQFIDTSGKNAVTLITANQNKLVLDDDNKKVELDTNGGHKLVMDDGGKITLQTSGGPKIVLESSGTVTVEGTTVNVNASSINLGQVATDPLVLGNQMMILFNAHVHTCTAPATPSSPPVTPMTPAQLSTISKTG